MAVSRGAVHNPEKFTLQSQGDWPGNAFIDVNLIYGTNRSNFRGGAAEENLFSKVEHFARDHLLADRNTDVFGQPEHSVTGDAG